MSNEVSKQNNFGTNVLSYGAMPAMYAGVPAVMALKRHGRNVFKVQNNAGFKELNATLKKQGQDVFTRSQSLALGYDKYKDLANQATKSTKQYNRLAKKGKLPLIERFKNLFKSDKTKFEEYKKALFNKKTTATDKLNFANGAIKNYNKESAAALDSALGLVEIDKKTKATKTLAGGFDDAIKATSKIAGEAAESTLKASCKGFGKYVKNNFKNEVGFKHGKLNYFMTAMQFIPNIKNEVIPAFKEEGFWAGIKATGKTLLRGAADLFGYAAGGSIGRAIGATVGTIIAPGVGSKVGAFLGDVVFSMFIGTKVTSTVDKLVGAEETPEDTENSGTETMQNTAPSEVLQNEQPNQAIEQNNEVIDPNSQKSLDINKTLTADQVKALAYQQAFAPYKPSPQAMSRFYA